jgi:hypothetical protein
MHVDAWLVQNPTDSVGQQMFSDPGFCAMSLGALNFKAIRGREQRL